MKRIYATLIALLVIISVLAGFDDNKSTIDFDSFAVGFYTEMIIAGEHTDELETQYEQLKEYQSEQDQELYIALENMYIALNSDGSATPYQLEAMRLINK
ncbi:hypothetical protein [Jeotgalibacillus proteolyticus]|uniref:DUF4363 domain-containing protein n=1 Tax=Jeotgalibacillus proteolyticus TaxID=2082395 RepID=A0A2S5GAL1_9BACL|nr:hypothetical protein [Jeotgalibacillus proteolyticus]PPA70026.1 hypothetical protein C4B60_10545 [Jeotgalibacillus proteolyticus]